MPLASFRRLILFVLLLNCQDSYRKRGSVRGDDPKEARCAVPCHWSFQLDLALSAGCQIVRSDSGRVQEQLQSIAFSKISKVTTKVNWNLLQTDVDGVWGEETDFQLSGSYSNQIKNTESEQDLRVEVTGSSIYPIEFAYSYHTNKSALEAQIQVK